MNISVGKPEKKSLLRRNTRVLEGNIKIYCKEIISKAVDKLYLVYNTVNWR